MIGRVRLCERRKAPARPIKVAAIHDDTADGSAMTTDELGSRVNNDITAVLKWLHEVWRRKGVIQNERKAIFVRNICYSLNIQCVESWITYRFGENCFGALVDSWSEVLRITAVDESDVDAEFGERVVEQVICATVKTGRADDFITCLGDVEDSQCFSRLS